MTIDISLPAELLAPYPRKTPVKQTYMLLTVTEERLFAILQEHAGTICSHRFLSEALYGDDLGIAAVRTHVARLRRKLGDDAVETINRRGYRVKSLDVVD